MDKISKAFRAPLRAFSRNSAVASEANTEECFNHIELKDSKDLKLHSLEDNTPDKTSAILLRRSLFTRSYPLKTNGLEELPVRGVDFDNEKFYSQVYGSNCENVVGFLPLPVGLVGPFTINNEDFLVPLATTEGALLASINRGASVITRSGGCVSTVIKNAMTRAPLLEFRSAQEAAEFAKYVVRDDVVAMLKDVFGTTTNYGKLLDVEPTVAGRLVFLRFSAFTGDAMGMNMIGKGVNQILLGRESQHALSDNGRFRLKIVSLSSNLCTDKKPSAINWIQGRGKSVVCEAVIPEEILKSVLSVTVEDIVALNVSKNLIGSSLAGSIGGNNAHSSNIVTALFLATGQDPAQNIESSNCLVQMNKIMNESEEVCLNISVTMPSIEVGTVGGGTHLPAQLAALKILGVNGSNPENPGENAVRLSQIVAAAVLAGELNLNAALCSNQLMSAHLKLNRK